MKKVAQKLFVALRSKILRKSCCVATHNGFLAIGQAARKPVICYFVNRHYICTKDVIWHRVASLVASLSKTMLIFF